MSDDYDNDDSDGDEREPPPAVSRIGRAGRSYRSLSRPNNRNRGRDRFSRLRKQLPIEELIGRVVHRCKLTDEVRQRFVCLYWLEIAGERIASRTFPIAFADGVFQVSATTSSWVHEMQFFRAQLIAQINSWIDTNRGWLGPPPLVTDIRFVLGGRQREALVDREHAQRLRLHRLWRRRPRVEVIPPTTSDADRDAIRAETSSIDDSELRAVIESVRMKWNR